MVKWPLYILSLIMLLSACIPIQRNPSSDTLPTEPISAPIATAEPIQPIYALSLRAIANQTLIERFDPPGAGSSVAGSIAAQAKNTNPFGVTLTKVDYEIFLQGKSVFEGSITPEVFVEANEQVPLSFPFDASLEKQKDLIKSIAQSITGTPLPYRLEGSMTFTSQSYGFTTEKVTLLFGDMLSEQKLEAPTLTLNVNLSNVYALRENVPIIQTVLDITNEGDIGYFISGKEITLYINNLKMAVQDIAPYPIAAGQEGSFEVLFYPDISQLSENALGVLQSALEGDTVNLHLKGLLSLDVLGVDTYEIPEWDVKGTINE
jgi:LEA14-like dessication related protein